MSALRELRERLAMGEPFGDLPRPYALHTDLCWKAFSGSLDAAKTLHGALLPGWHLMLEDCRPDDLATVQIGSVVSLDTGLEGDMPISRLWLLAILDVLIQKEADHADDQ